MVSYAAESTSVRSVRREVAPVSTRSATDPRTLAAVEPSASTTVGPRTPATQALARVGSLAVTAVAPDELTAEQTRAWDALHEQQPTPSNSFLARSWVLEWYDKFVQAEDRLVLVVHQDRGADGFGDVVAIAPMHIHRPSLGPVRVARRLLPAGTGLGQMAFEIPGLLCRTDQTSQAIRAVVAACLKLPVDWSELALTPEQGWFDSQWAGGSDAAMAFGEFVRPRACVVLPLADSWEATKSGLKRNVKESIRRSANRLKKDPRSVEVTRRDTDLDTSTVERFLHLHQARASLSRSTQRHHPDAYADDRNRRLMLDVLPQLGQQGQASMFELYLDGEHVASQLALHSSGTSYVHSSGFREDVWELGVITHLQAELIRYAVERGDTVVNFSPGPNVSKTRWSEQLWVTHEFAFGAGPRTLTPRFAAFQMLSALRATLGAAGLRRSHLAAARQ